LARVIFILLITSAGLFADYKQALTHYNEGLYQQALDEAKRSKKNYSNPNLHLVWAYSAQVLGQTEDAMHAFERVLILDANNKQAKEALRKIYRQTDRTELLSKEERSYVYKLRGRGAPVRLEKKHTLPIKVSASLALGYDSNVNTTPGSAVLDNYFDTDDHDDEISSFFSRVTAGIHYRYALDEEEGAYMKTSLRAFSQSNFSAHLYDLSTVSLELGAGYAQKAYDLYFPVSYHKVNYLDRDLLEHIRFLPTVLVPIGDDIIIDVSVLYSQNNYISDDDQAKNDSTTGISAGGYFLFGDHFAYLSAKYENKKAQDADPTKYISAEFFTATLGVNYYFTPSLVGAVDYRFRYGRYGDAVGLSNTIRDDNLHLLDIKLSYLLSKKSQIFISENYAQNLSNYIPSEYKKNSIILGVSVNF